MNNTKLLAGFAVAAALALAACGGGDSAKTSATVLPAAPTVAASVTTSATAAPAGSPAPAATAASATATNAPASPTPPTATTTAAPTSAPAATPVPPTATSPAAPAVSSVTVTAENLAFDRSVIRVKAGTTLTANFVNKDVGVEHNLTFSLPGLGHPTCPGPCTTSQTFTPTKPGTESFFCTLHATMFGDFIVE